MVIGLGNGRAACGGAVADRTVSCVVRHRRLDEYRDARPVWPGRKCSVGDSVGVLGVNLAWTCMRPTRDTS